MHNDIHTREELSRAVVKIQSGVLAVVCGIMGGLGLFLMTAWLLIEGGPQVGSHLQLLSNYFYGYSVTWPGAFIGFFYGCLTCAVGGWAAGTIYNKVVDVRGHKPV